MLNISFWEYSPQISLIAGINSSASTGTEALSPLTALWVMFKRFFTLDIHPLLKDGGFSSGFWCFIWFHAMWALFTNDSSVIVAPVRWRALTQLSSNSSRMGQCDLRFLVFLLSGFLRSSRWANCLLRILETVDRWILRPNFSENHSAISAWGLLGFSEAYLRFLTDWGH